MLPPQRGVFDSSAILPMFQSSLRGSLNVLHFPPLAQNKDLERSAFRAPGSDDIAALTRRNGLLGHRVVVRRRILKTGLFYEFCRHKWHTIKNLQEVSFSVDIGNSTSLTQLLRRFGHRVFINRPCFRWSLNLFRNLCA